MIFKAIVEYEYPIEHKPPVKAEIVLHGDRVIANNIKPFEQKRGHWIFPNASTRMICECSICGGNGEAFGKFKFCPHCGAKMEVEQNG